MFVLRLFNNNLVKCVAFGKWLSIRSKKDCLIHTVTILLYGQLNHILFSWECVGFFCWLPLQGEW